MSTYLSTITFEFKLSSNRSIHFYYLGAEVNPDNYSHPIQYYLDEIDVYPSSSFSREIQLQLQNNDYITKTGLFFNEINTISFINVKHSLVNYYDTNNSLVINFVSGKHKTVTIRTYINIYEIISNIVGSSEIIFSFFTFLISPLGLLKFYHQIVNTVFTFDSKKTENTGPKKLAHNSFQKSLERINEKKL